MESARSLAVGDQCEDGGLLGTSPEDPSADRGFCKPRVITSAALAVALGAFLLSASLWTQSPLRMVGGGGARGTVNGTSAAYVLMGGCPAGLVAQGCMENGRLDGDCCAMQGTGRCVTGPTVLGGQCHPNGAVLTCCEVCPAGSHKHGCIENGKPDRDCCALPAVSGCIRGAPTEGASCGNNGQVTTCCSEEQVPAARDDDLFCWMVSFSSGKEAELTQLQFQKQLGIFVCSKYAVLSDGPMDPVPATSIASLEVKKGSWGSWANTAQFLVAWREILDQATWETCGWTVKVDPDAVWYPDRLLSRLRGQDSFWPEYFRTNDFMMLGPLEVLSHGAMKFFAARHATDCPRNPDYEGEDGWMTWCMDRMGVQMSKRPDFLVSARSVADCHNGWAVAFHPFKASKPWQDCHWAATHPR